MKKLLRIKEREKDSSKKRDPYYHNHTNNLRRQSTDHYIQRNSVSHSQQNLLENPLLSPTKESFTNDIQHSLKSVSDSSSSDIQVQESLDNCSHLPSLHSSVSLTSLSNKVINENNNNNNNNNINNNNINNKNEISNSISHSSLLIDEFNNSNINLDATLIENATDNTIESDKIDVDEINNNDDKDFSFSSKDDVSEINILPSENSIYNSIKRRDSYHSTISTSTNLSSSTENIALKKKVSGDLKRLGRNVIPKHSLNNRKSLNNMNIDQSFISSRINSNNYLKSNNLSNNNHSQFPISTLIKQDWDINTAKSSWVNRINDGIEPRLFRLELRGSVLLVFKPHSDLLFAKNLIVDDNNKSPDSNEGMLLNNEFVKNTAELTINSNSLPNDMIMNMNMNDNITINEKESPSIYNELNKDDTKIDDSTLLSQAIDEFESKLKIRDNLTIKSDDTIDNNNNNTNNNNDDDLLIDLQSINMQKVQSDKSFSSNRKHLPLIIHDLYYQSPSCPHPKLVFDTSSGLILKGTLEAVCHTILFYPSDRMAEKLIEILPLIGSLVDPLVYFQKFLDHFTDIETLKRKSIKISSMETQILFKRIKKIIEITMEKFYGSLLDDEIFKLLNKLVTSLRKNCLGYFNDEILLKLSNDLQNSHNSLLKLISFQLSPSRNNKNLTNESLNVLSTDLISGEDFIMTSTDILAYEIHAIDSHFMKFWSPRSDRSSIFSRLDILESSFQYWRFNPLQFIPPIHTHYLGRLLAYHIFEDKTTSKTVQKRANILMKWIHLGTTLCEQGDMVSWLGIAILICSQPVLRLTETWGYVDKSYLQIIKKKWAPVVFEIRKNELFSTKYPADLKNHSLSLGTEINDTSSLDSSKNDTNSNIRIMITNRAGELYAKEDAIPYFGELFTTDSVDFKSIRNLNSDSSLMDSNDNSDSSDLFNTDFIKSYCSYLETVDWNLKQWDNYYDDIENNPEITSIFQNSDDSNDPSIIKACKNFDISQKLKTAITFNSSNGPFPINYFMRLSTTIEPPYLGQLARFHNTSRSPLFLGSYAPILFPEILPSYKIYDRTELIGAIGGSKLLNTIEPERKLKNRNVFLKNIRDLFNVSGDEFKLKDNSIIFKTNEILNGSKSILHDQIDKDKNDIGKRSRPSSILFENPNKSKHVSTVSTGSFSLDDYINSYQSYLKDAINIESSTISSFDHNKLDNQSADNLNPSNSEKNNRVPIVTTAASTERLIDLLVLTSSVFGTHIKTEDLQNYSIKNNNSDPILFQMDNIGFTYTFFATYRVFYSTKQLIDALHKRFDGSKSAALSIAKSVNSSMSSTDIEFPNWDTEFKSNDDNWKIINWKFVIQIQLGVVEATLILVSDYFSHFMDDLITKSAFDTFLEMMDITIVTEWPKILNWLKLNSTPEIVNDVIEVYKSLQNAYKQVRNICIRKSYTPQSEPVELSFTCELKTIPNDMLIPESNEISALTAYVKRMDETIASVMSHIRAEDWIDTFEIIQMLITKSPLAMFNYNYQDSTTHIDLIKISNIFHWILTMNDNETSKNLSGQLIKKFPPTVRSIFKLYERMKNYILLQIVDSECTLNERIDKMRSLLKIIQICRIRMKNINLFEEDNEITNTLKTSSPYVSSFIESAIVNTIMLPESRFFSHAWRLAASISNTSLDGELSCDKLEDMLTNLSKHEGEFIERSPLAICPGWVLGRLVEIACFIPNMDVDNTLVNFNKNRFVHHCVLKIHSIQSFLNTKLSPYSTEFSFLFEFDDSLPDLKKIYEISLAERYKEKLEKCSVFKTHILEQIQLLKLEENKRDLLIRQRETNNISIREASSLINTYTANTTEPLPFDNYNASIAETVDTEEHGNSSAILETSSFVNPDTSSVTDSASYTAVNTVSDANQSIQSINSTQSTRSTQSFATTSTNKTMMNSNPRSHRQNLPPSNQPNKFKFGFFKSRPFSLNINNFSQPVAEKRSVYVDELPSASTFVIRSSELPKQKPYMTIMLKDASAFLTYRTPNSFSIDTSTSSNNRTEYTFQTASESEASDWIYRLTYAKKHWFYSKALNKQYAHNNVRLTFGAPLEFVCERDNADIPMVIEKIFSEIELRGLEEVGIYRKSASLTIVQQIKDEVNKIGDFNMENSLVFDIHNLTGCIKAYLRELPEPLIKDSLVDELSVVRDVAQNNSRFEIYKSVFSKLPVSNYNLIERLTRHMKLIEEYKSQNRMTSYNLATIMGGSLVEGCSPVTMRKSFGLMNFICEDWILHYDRVFQ